MDLQSEFEISAAGPILQLLVEKRHQAFVENLGLRQEVLAGSLPIVHGQRVNLESMFFCTYIEHLSNAPSTLAVAYDVTVPVINTPRLYPPNSVYTPQEHTRYHEDSWNTPRICARLLARLVTRCWHRRS